MGVELAHEHVDGHLGAAAGALAHGWLALGEQRFGLVEVQDLP